MTPFTTFRSKACRIEIREPINSKECCTLRCTPKRGQPLGRANVRPGSRGGSHVQLAHHCAYCGCRAEHYSAGPDFSVGAWLRRAWLRRMRWLWRVRWIWRRHWLRRLWRVRRLWLRCFLEALRRVRFVDRSLRHDKVNAPIHERPRAFARRVDDRLLMHVEAGVDEHRSASLAVEG